MAVLTPAARDEGTDKAARGWHGRTRRDQEVLTLRRDEVRERVLHKEQEDRSAHGVVPGVPSCLWTRALRAHQTRVPREERAKATGRPGTRPRGDLRLLREHPCLDCDERDILLLDFDHRDPSTKREAVARLALSAPLSAVMAEIAKCDVRCGNCHRKRTAAQFNWRKHPGFHDDRRAQLAPLRRPPRDPSTGIAVTEQLSIWSVGVMMRCPRCASSKPAHEFAFEDRRTGKRQHHCRACQAALRHEHYLKNRERYIEWAVRQGRKRRDEQVGIVHEHLRAHPCVDCGETDIQLLEFDHIDGAPKVMEISIMIGRRNTQVLLAEMAKCDVRCVNCRRRRTAERANWRRLLGEEAVTYNAGTRGCVVVVANELPKLGVGVRFASPAQ